MTKHTPHSLAAILLASTLPLSPAGALACGDCDGNGVFVTILDALAAAQFALSAIPTPAQLSACDVDDSTRITVLDALRLAQSSAGVPVTLSCCTLPCTRVVSCRAVDALGTQASGPTGVNPAFSSANGGPGNVPLSGEITDTNPGSTNWWAFDYVGLNQGEFDNGRQLTDAAGDPVGNPVVLCSAGHDYSAAYPSAAGPCNPRDTFQVVLEALITSASGSELMLDLAPAQTPLLTANFGTLWSSSDPGVVSVSADGLLQAEAENACATISWSLSSDRPYVVSVLPSAAMGSFAACVDSAGVDTTTRQVWMPIGDLDVNFPGSPSGPPVPAVGGLVSMTIVVNTGSVGLAAYALRVHHDPMLLPEATSVENMGVGGSSRSAIDPFAVSSGGGPDVVRWNGIDASGSNSGIFDLSTVHFWRGGSGSAYFQLVNEELADPLACNIWIPNPCMPFGTTPACVTPPMGGYLTIAGTTAVALP